MNLIDNTSFSCRNLPRLWPRPRRVAFRDVAFTRQGTISPVLRRYWGCAFFLFRAPEHHRGNRSASIARRKSFPAQDFSCPKFLARARSLRARAGQGIRFFESFLFSLAQSAQTKSLGTQAATALFGSLPKDFAGKLPRMISSCAPIPSRHAPLDVLMLLLAPLARISYVRSQRGNNVLLRTAVGCGRYSCVSDWKWNDILVRTPPIVFFEGKTLGADRFLHATARAY